MDQWTSRFAFSGHGHQFLDRLTGQFRGPTWPICSQWSGRQGNAQDHALAVRHQHMTWTVRRHAHRDQEKTASEEGMPRVRDLNFRWTGVTWVLEQGIELWDRLTEFLMNGFSLIFQWKKLFLRNG
jgi:hypothetical protein